MPPITNATSTPTASAEEHGYTREDFEAAASVLYPELTAHKFQGSEIVAKNAKDQTVFIHQDILVRAMSQPRPRTPKA